MVAPRDGWRAGVAVVIVFAVSRVGYYLAGVRFLWRHAPFYLHFIDPDLLKHRLLQSLWYDHAQPPGLNLIWGLALKVAPDHPDRVLWPLFLAVGLATALILLRLLIRVGLPAWAAVVVASLWTVSPTALTMESYLFYTPLEVLGLLAVVLLVARWAEAARPIDAVGALAVASALALTRATFHLVWILALVGVLALVRRDRWRIPAVAAVLPLVLVGGMYVKNQILFGQFGPSTWIGPNLSRITVEQLSARERARLSSGGELSRYAPYPAFATFAEMDIPPVEGDPSIGRGVPLLDRRFRRGTQFPNQRNRGYLAVDKARFHDALWVIEHRPGTYADGIQRASSLTFGDPVDFFGYDPNVDHMKPLVTAERWVLGGWQVQPLPASDALGRWGDLGRHEWVVLLAYLVALTAVPVVLVRRRAWRLHASAEALALVAWGTVAYLTVLTVVADFGENNRFRSVTDPAVLVLLAWLVATWRARSAQPGVVANGQSVRRASELRSDRGGRDVDHHGRLDGAKSLTLPTVSSAPRRRRPTRGSGSPLSRDEVGGEAGAGEGGGHVAAEEVDPELVQAPELDLGEGGPPVGLAALEDGQDGFPALGRVVAELPGQLLGLVRARRCRPGGLGS